MTEDVLQRLKQAEEEAQRLKKELAAAQAAVRARRGGSRVSTGGVRRRRLHVHAPEEPAAPPPASTCCRSNSATVRHGLTRTLFLPMPQASAGTAAAGEPAEPAAKRIDGGDLRRETLFSGVETKQRNWCGGGSGGPAAGAGACMRSAWGLHCGMRARHMAS